MPSTVPMTKRCVGSTPCGQGLSRRTITDRGPNRRSSLQVAETYTLATKTIAPRRAVGPYNLLWIHFAKFYEQGGVAGDAEKDLVSARKVFEKATHVPFRRVDELAEVWCEWAEMEVRNE